MKNVFKILDHLGDAHTIRRNPEAKAKSKKFGVMSIIYSLVSIPLAILGALAFQWLSGEGALLFIFVIAAMLVGVGGAIMMMLHSIVYWFIQLSLNRKAITWISLLVIIGAIVAIGMIVANVG